jgi:opacity protein-like surface antigen
MKKQSTRSNNTTYFALLFFAAMTVVGVTTAHAQDTINPLVSATGPNVLGSGHIQWNTSLMWDHTRNFNINGTVGFDGVGARTGFRFGIGNRAELTLGVEASHSVFNKMELSMAGSVISVNDLISPTNMKIAPSVGARLLLFEGRGWLPMVTFNTSIAMAATKGYKYESDTVIQPTIGLEFRNDLGKGWMLDYAVDFTWNRNSPRQNFPATTLSVFARWLATERLLIGAGFKTPNWTEPFKGLFEVRYLATPSLQLTLQGGLSNGNSLGSYWAMETHVVAGVRWMLR